MKKLLLMAPCCDLDWTGKPGESEVIPGAETARNLQRLAVYHARKIRSGFNPLNIEVVFTTGEAPNHNHIMVAEVMAKYYDSIFRQLASSNPNIYIRVAEEFNTLSEMEALSKHVLIGLRFEKHIQVVVLVKWWHWLRTAWLCFYAFLSLQHSWEYISEHVSIIPCRSVQGQTSFRVWKLAIIDFIGGTYMNIRRIRDRKSKKKAR